MANASQAKIISPKDLAKIRYPLSKSLTEAAGMLKGRKINPLAYQRRIRKEWEVRMKKLEKLWRYSRS